MCFFAYRKSRLHGSVEEIEALTRSRLKLPSQALELPDTTEQLELHTFKQPSPVKQLLEQEKHHPLTDNDQMLEMQKHQLVNTDQADHENPNSLFAGNVSLDLYFQIYCL